MCFYNQSMALSGTAAMLLRVLLGALTILFAHYLGRSWLRVRRAGEPKSRAITWTLRTVVTILGLTWWNGLDWVSILFLTLAAASCLAGLYLEKRPREEEHLEDLMFPKE